MCSYWWEDRCHKKRNSQQGYTLDNRSQSSALMRPLPRKQDSRQRLSSGGVLLPVEVLVLVLVLVSGLAPEHCGVGHNPARST